MAELNIFKLSFKMLNVTDSSARSFGNKKLTLFLLPQPLPKWNTSDGFGQLQNNCCINEVPQ